MGNDASQWRTHVPHYERVKYGDVYAGIDLEFYEKDRHHEYDFIVAPYADPAQIRLSFKGNDAIRLDGSGNLIIQTANGELIQYRPYTYQRVNGKKQEIASAYQLEGDEVSIQLAAYDTRKTLVIDPGLTYSTYMGGSSKDSAEAITVDGGGNIYVVGSTQSSNFPVTGTGSRRKIGDADNLDAFISKYNADGQLLFSTYWGSTGPIGDRAVDVALDSNGRIYVAGEVDDKGLNTKAFSTTIGAYQRSPGGNTDGFLTIFSGDGSQFLYSTLFGGSLGEKVGGLAVDAAGDAYIVGETRIRSNSVNLFETKNAFDATIATNALPDGFIIRISPKGQGNVDLIYASFIGGANPDMANDVAVDGNGVAYITGTTSSSDFPVSGANVFQTSLGGSSDAFLVKVDTTLSGASSLLYSSYLGGASEDKGNAIAIDTSGNTYITGMTRSTDFPGNQTVSIRGNSDAFVLKVNASGGSLDYVRFFAGAADEEGLVLDAQTNAYWTGWSRSSDFFVTTNLSNFATAYNGGTSDAIVLKINPTGLTTQFSLLYGGSSADQGRGIAIDSAGSNTYFVGSTASASNFRLTANALQNFYGGGSSDAFIARIGPFSDLSVVINDTPDPVVLDTNTGQGALTYTIDVRNLGADTATGVTLEVTLPNALSAIYVSDDSG